MKTRFGYHAVPQATSQSSQTLIIFSITYVNNKFPTAGMAPCGTLNRLQQALHRVSSHPCTCSAPQGNPALGKPDSVPLPGY